MLHKNNKWYDVTISNKGDWVETYIINNYEDLPEKIRLSLEDPEFSEYDLNRILQLDSPKSKSYKLLLSNYQDKELELIYNDKGELTNKK